MPATHHALAVLDFTAAQRADQGQVQFADHRVLGGQAMEHAVMRDDFRGAA
ncbi:hypothetical protein D3C84_1000770 [compost metagenome]